MDVPIQAIVRFSTSVTARIKVKTKNTFLGHRLSEKLMIMFVRIAIYISVFRISSQSDEGLVIQLYCGTTWSFLITR